MNLFELHTEQTTIWRGGWKLEKIRMSNTKKMSTLFFLQMHGGKVKREDPIAVYSRRHCEADITKDHLLQSFRDCDRRDYNRHIGSTCLRTEFGDEVLGHPSGCSLSLDFDLDHCNGDHSRRNSGRSDQFLSKSPNQFLCKSPPAPHAANMNVFESEADVQRDYDSDALTICRASSTSESLEGDPNPRLEPGSEKTTRAPKNLGRDL